MNFTELLNSATQRGNQLIIDIPESWQQGRATFGGLTAAICLQAALPHADGRPVRSAQIAFVGPAGGLVTATPTVLRRGKNTAFVAVQLANDLGIAAEAIIVFGAPRPSVLNTRGRSPPDVPDPDECGYFIRPDVPIGPSFSANFEMRPTTTDDQSMFGRPAGSTDLTMWMRHGDGTQPINAVSAFGIADGPPPVAAMALAEPAPLSSMTWMAEFLVDDITTTDGWFLAHHVDEYAANGYSSQSMTMYNIDRQPIIVGRQAITIFA